MSLLMSIDMHEPALPSVPHMSAPHASTPPSDGAGEYASDGALMPIIFEAEMITFKLEKVLVVASKSMTASSRRSVPPLPSGLA